MRKTNQIPKPVAWLLPALLLWACGGNEEQQVPVGSVVKGTFYVDMYEEGEIEAVNSITVPAPMISWRYGNPKITEIVKDGKEVAVGDTLIVFDQAEVNKGIIEANDRLEISLAELEKMKAQHQSEIEELTADYEVTRISQEISKINFEQAEYESEIKKREIKLNLDKADISLERALEQIENRKKIQQEEIKQKNLSIEQDRKRLTEAHETLEKMYVRSPSPGIVILARNWNNSGNKFQVGDQCWAGFPLIELPDLSKLKVKVNINEVDIAKISKGLNVEVRPDAFSDNVFTGSVNSVANLAVTKEGSTRIKVFPVEVYLNETHKDLLPGLTASCRLIIDEIDNVLYIPLDALRTEGETNFVYKKSGSDYERADVETGQVNSDYVIITGGLEEGDEIALADPFRKEEQEQSEDAAENEETPAPTPTEI